MGPKSFGVERIVGNFNDKPYVAKLWANEQINKCKPYLGFLATRKNSCHATNGVLIIVVVTIFKKQTAKKGHNNGLCFPSKATLYGVTSPLKGYIRKVFFKHFLFFLYLVYDIGGLSQPHFGQV